MFRPIIFILLTATAGAVTLTPESAPTYAAAHNPQLAAARLRIDEARGRLQQSGRLSNPELETEYRQNVRSSEYAVGFAFKQKFPVTARLRLDRAVSAAQLAAAEAEIRDTARLLTAEVRMGTVKVLALQGRRALTEKQHANSRQLAEFTTRRVRAGEASAADALQVDLEAGQLAAELLRLDTERAALFATLRPLLGLGAEQPLEITGTLAEPNPTDWRVASSERPDHTAVQRLAEAARQQAALAKAQRWEDIGIDLLAEQTRTEDAPDGLRHDTMIGLRFTLPLPLWNRNEGRIAETTAAAARAEREVEASATRLTAEAAGTRAELRALAKLLVQLDAELLPKSAQIEEQLRAAYESGQAALPEVLRARDQRLQLRRQQLDALRDYQLALARHAAATGITLPAAKSK